MHFFSKHLSNANDNIQAFIIINQFYFDDLDLPFPFPFPFLLQPVQNHDEADFFRNASVPLIFTHL